MLLETRTTERRTHVRRGVLTAGAAVLLAVSPLIPTRTACAQSAPKAVAGRTLDGAWQGVMTLGMEQKPIRVWFDGRGGGRFQIVGLTSDRNPLNGVTAEGDRIRFTLPSSPPQNFSGRRQGTVITGTMRMLGMSSPFRLEKVD